MSVTKPSTSASPADSMFSASLAESDPEVARLVGLELGRQRRSGQPASRWCA
jgi:hypothetical protein